MLWVLTVVCAVAFASGTFSGLLVTPAAAACDKYQIYGPIPVYVDVTPPGSRATSYFSGNAETYARTFPCTNHTFRVWGTFHSGYLGNQNVFWLLWLNTPGVTVGSVYLQADEWIAQGGVGFSYVYIGQYAGRNRYPEVGAYVPSSLWGQTYSISMRMASNTWDCSSIFASCGGMQTYYLVG